MAAQQTKPLTDARLTAIRRRLQRLTERPWEVRQSYAGWDVYGIPRHEWMQCVVDPTAPEHWDYIAGQYP